MIPGFLHSSEKNALRFGICCLLGAVIFYIYSDVRNFEFNNYDDPLIIYNNPTITGGLTWEGFKTAWTQPVVYEMWYPLTALSHMIDWELFGSDAGKHHLINVFFHLANVLLLLWGLHRMTGSFWPSACVAFLVAVHPLNVEAVAWASQRKTLLSMFFYLGSLWFYARYCEEPNRRHYLFMLLLYFCGLLAKPLLITMPFALLLLDFWPMNRWSGDSKRHPEAFSLLIPALRRWNLSKTELLLLEKAPFLLLTLFFSVLTYHFAFISGNLKNDQLLPILNPICNAIQSYAIYLGQTLFPNNLAVFYPWENVYSPTHIALYFLFLTAMSVLALWLRKRLPFLIVGWLWYLGVMFPVIGLVDSGTRAHADRYAYATLIGVFIALVWAGKSLTQKHWIKNLISILTLSLILTYAQLSKHQVAVWKNSFTLFQHAIKVGYPSSLAYNNIGAAYVDSRQIKKAQIEFQKAVELDPSYPEALNNLGATLVEDQKYEEARILLEKVLKLHPRHTSALFNLGNAHYGLKKYVEAIEFYKQVLTIKPHFPKAYHNQGNSFIKLGRYEEALSLYQKALELNPKLSESHYAAGNALQRLSRLNDAVSSYKKALQYTVETPEAYNQIAGILFLMRRFEDAIPYYEKGLLLQPDSAELHNNFGACLSAIKRHQDALKEFEKAIQIQANNLFVHYNRANTLAALKRYPEAIQEFQHALQIDPKNPEIFFDQGITWMSMQNWKQAITSLEQTLHLNSDHVGAKLNLGVIYLKTRKRTEGLKRLRSLAQVEPAKANAVFEAAQELQARGLYPEALLFLNEFLNTHSHHPQALTLSAWILATAPEKTLRNGPEAVRFAQKAYSLFPSPSATVLDTLAVAWAECEEFDEALFYGRKALETAQTHQENSLAKEIEKRIGLYRSHQPYRDLVGRVR